MMSRRRYWIATGFLIAIPAVVVAWGTLTDRLPMSDKEESDLRYLIGTYGQTPTSSAGEIEARKGPHPTHQFIVSQAYALLREDPAFKDGESGFPSLEAILCWDGIVRVTGRTDGKDGMWERHGGGEGFAAAYAPTKLPFGGPSADAEIVTGGYWNPEYDGASHYWNPWLQCGSAPSASGVCYARLVQAIVGNDYESVKGKNASHMGHFVADAVTPKHADVVILDSLTLVRLSSLADQWASEQGRDLKAWLASPLITQAETLIARDAGGPSSEQYWRRVDRHIGQAPLLKEDAATLYPDIALPSLRTSVASYLWALHNRPKTKDLVRFYGFYDPFYYNGQLVMLHGTSLSGTPEFGLATPTSEHLLWETQPKLVDFVKSNIGSTPEALWGSGDPAAYYMPLRTEARYSSFEKDYRPEGLKMAMEDLVKRASLAQHGNDPLDGRDFALDYQPSMKTAVKALFSAFRASITAIRVKARYRPIASGNKFKITCDVGNLAEEPVTLQALRVATRQGDELSSKESWIQTLNNRTVQRGERQRVSIEVAKPEGLEGEPDFVVEVTGTYAKTPDAGRRRARVQKGDERIIRGMGMPDLDVPTDAPLDLAIVFDVTQSMSGAIDSVRQNAIDVIRRLKERVPDMRVALVAFRDKNEDKRDAFWGRRFSSDLEGAFAAMNRWKARGGGDDPEDQLKGIKYALRMWQEEGISDRKPTKIVVAISDNGFHDPDFEGNTDKSIADLAEKVDPAHIYPIVVGSNRTAIEGANRLATLTDGEVLSASQGSEVANVLLQAVDKAIERHGSRGGFSIPAAWLFCGGLCSLIVGSWWLWRDRRRAA